MQAGTTTILIADDDNEDLELIETAFSGIDAHTRILKVNNGKAVIDLLSHQPDHELPCLVILDYNMPELNGSEVLAVISKDKRYESIPKIVLSTSNASHFINECKRNGATEYFVKPDTMDELMKLARKMLAYCNKNS
jgi:CheY-like chemotaxis protein